MKNTKMSKPARPVCLYLGGRQVGGRQAGRHIFRVFIIIAFSLICSRYASAQYLIPHSVIGSGGVTISNSVYSINGTLGQSVTGVTSSSSHNSYSGFWYLESSSITSIKDKTKIPLSFELMQNYPNPFNPSTMIRYTIGTSQLSAVNHVTLKVYDILGREVAALVNEKQSAGSYSVAFDASRLASGVYLYRLVAGSFVSVKKLVVMK